METTFIFGINLLVTVPKTLRSVWFAYPSYFENEPLSSLLQFNHSLVFLPYVNFEKVAISSLRSLQNKMEKRINELPELLPTLFKDFMEIKNLLFKIFYYRRHNKAGVSVLLAVTKTRNDPQRPTTIHNDPQRPPTIPQRSTTTHNDPQPSSNNRGRSQNDPRKKYQNFTFEFFSKIKLRVRGRINSFTATKEDFITCFEGRGCLSRVMNECLAYMFTYSAKK